MLNNQGIIVGSYVIHKIKFESADSGVCEGSTISEVDNCHLIMKLYLKAFLISLKITIQILLLLILILAVFTFVTSKTAILGNIRSFVVLSGSMSPSIPTGSVIYTRKLPEYWVGDVIAFQKGDQVVTHRLMIIEGLDGQAQFRTQGDANNSLDQQSITQDNVLGKVFVKAFYIGYLVMFLKSVLGFFLLIILPALLFIGLELWDMKKEFEKEVEKKIMRRLNIL